MWHHQILTRGTFFSVTGKIILCVDNSQIYVGKSHLCLYKGQLGVSKSKFINFYSKN